MKKLPISIQTFEDIIEREMIYVDKTPLIHKLVNEGKYFFLARPRRFGKSLLLTTLKAYFEGKKDQATFKLSLLENLQFIAKQNGLSLKNTILANAFKELVIELSQKHDKKVVVLVDEYDKALVDTLTNKSLFEGNKEVVRNIYGAMKGLDNYLHFVMLTGVSRFSKVNVFSGLNNLTDKN